jgi:hypothetical protein
VIAEQHRVFRGGIIIIIAIGVAIPQQVLALLIDATIGAAVVIYVGEIDKESVVLSEPSLTHLFASV